MRAGLSGSSGEATTGEGSRDGSNREAGDSDGGTRTLSGSNGRVTGLRSARQRPKRQPLDEVSCSSGRWCAMVRGRRTCVCVLLRCTRPH